MKVIYVAGPYRAPNAWEVEQNIRRAEMVAAQVWGMGHAALCPQANARHMIEGCASQDVALPGMLEMMLRCDAVILVPGWGTSSGTRAEVVEAIRRGLPVFGTESEHAPKDGPEHARMVDRALFALANWLERVQSNTLPKMEAP